MARNPDNGSVLALPNAGDEVRQMDFSDVETFVNCQFFTPLARHYSRAHAVELTYTVSPKKVTTFIRANSHLNHNRSFCIIIH
jgi:hypothetical protein